LTEAGIKVVRFWNHDVLNATEDVLSALYEHLMERKFTPES